jgi:hypothetical protein
VPAYLAPSKLMGLLRDNQKYFDILFGKVGGLKYPFYKVNSADPHPELPVQGSLANN